MAVRVGLLVLIVSGTISAATFSKTIPVSLPWAHRYMDVAQLSDGTYAATIAMVFEDLVLLQFSSEGDLITEQDSLSVAGRGLEEGGWILPCSEGGCFVVAYSEPRATGVNSDIAVFKLSLDCSSEWTLVLGEDSEEVYTCFDAAKTADGGLAILGGRGYAGDNTFVNMYSAEGELRWEYVFDEEAGYLPRALGETVDGTLVLLSHMGEENTYLQKLDSEGNLEWSQTIPFRSYPGPVSFCTMSTGISIYFTSYNDSGIGITAMVDHSGNLIEVGQLNHGMRVQDVLLEEDQTVILAGTRIIDGARRAVLEAFDDNQNLSWQRRLNGNGEDSFDALCATSDHGYAILGHTVTDDEQETIEAILVKTNSDGIVSGGTNPTQIPLYSEVTGD